MTANFRRGLFRVWIVVAVLWVIPFLFLTVGAGRRYASLHDKVKAMHRFEEEKRQRIAAAPKFITDAEMAALVASGAAKSAVASELFSDDRLVVGSHNKSAPDSHVEPRPQI